MFKVKPLFDRVLVRRTLPDDFVQSAVDGQVETRGGLSVPQSSLESRPEVEVLAIGPHCDKLVKQGVEVGSKVLLGDQSGVGIGSDEFLVYEEEILALLIDMGPDDSSPSEDDSSTGKVSLK